MIEPINIPREQFPKSNIQSDGMITLNVNCDNQTMEYVPDIEYINRDGIKLYIQLLLPSDRTESTPLVVYVPGSAFHWQNVKGVIPTVSLLVNRGFAVAMVQYRGSEVAAFPAQMLDAKAAVRFMKLSAHKYGLNSENVYLGGDSSGGHTVLMAGLTAGIPEFEEEIYSEVSSCVKGIIDLYGPTDITKMNDELVPFGQSCMLYDKLIQCEKDAAFYAIDNAHHGGREFWSNEVLDIIEEFINRE